MLIPAALRVIEEVRSFRSELSESLHPQAFALFDFVSQRFSPSQPPSGLPGLGGLIAALGTAKIHFEFFMVDREAPAKRLVERAFLHLKRSIVADKDIAAKWQRAWGEGETACEALGACHLLLHGIWAFKAHSSGERTDLILGHALSPNEANAVDAMALTEWKTAPDKSQAIVQAESARRQAAIYAAGSLGGFEIRSVRYIIVVSNEQVALPADVVEGGITYHHVNVPVEPKTPSTAARIRNA